MRKVSCNAVLPKCNARINQVVHGKLSAACSAIAGLRIASTASTPPLPLLLGAALLDAVLGGVLHRHSGRETRREEPAPAVAPDPEAASRVHAVKVSAVHDVLEAGRRRRRRRQQ